MTIECESLINQLLLPILGSNELIEEWWNSPNFAFDSQTPKEIFAIHPEEVLQYVYGQYNR